ncbi:MAG TPA: exodeoxyribonuclease V subunit gamma [Acidimicrobiales bacterium]|nr:exodeoxyribonuclease V subunit gamma [Acidimicrobiales bacterium]
MLHVHRSDRADELVARLAELVALPLPDPMQAEVVSVPTRGIERWLTQRLSGQLGAREGRHDGVCANVVFPFPGVLVNRALASASDADPDADPWVPNRAVWPLMELVEGHFDEGWLAPLAEHIRKSRTVEESKRFSSVRHVADLFDRYAVHRPDMLQRWADGTPQLGEGSEASWQVDLWLRLRDRIGPPSPAERLREACQKLRQNRGLVDLPDRFSLFGLTRLPSSYLDVLEALGAGRDVHLFLLHPSPALWDRLQPHVGPASRLLFRREDPTAAMPDNPLLASWGRDAREMQLVLGGAVSHGPDPEEVVPGPRTLLRQVQEDIRADRLPVGDGGFGAATDPRPFLADDDDSIRIHSCHGRSRQVEVLRDAILHELEADSELELRDVIIMCPDIENYAPLIEATFGARDRIDGHEDTTSQLEIRLADRALRRTNPLMGVLADVLDLAGARMTATQVIDLAGREPVRRRFRFSDDDLSRLEEWVRESHVRWGFDADHREAFRLGGIAANTWRSGLDRILLGVAMADERERLFEGTAPLDDVDTGDIELAGRLAEFVERLRSATDDLAPLRTIDEWAKTLAGISDSLSLPAAEDLWQRSQLTALLEEVVKEATSERGVSPVVLSCDDVRSILADRLKGQPTRANFRTGHLTVCTLVPMRSIPHKVVCLLGLDDGSFPRHIERDGDDLTALEARVGDRDVRSEDRQLLLDALLAARERLIITYTGRDERSNLRRPPAVPVGELLDVVDRTMRVPEGPARAAITVTHPLQPFDARNYVPGALVAGRPWSFDTVHLDGARAARAPREAVAPFLSGPLPERSGPVSLDLLDRFVQHPVRVFLRERLGVSLFDRTRDFEDAIPIALDGLSTWQVGERMLRARLGGADWATCRAAEVARGGLPPGELAEPSLLDMEHDVEALVQASETSQGGTAATSIAVDLELTGLPHLAGVVPGVRGDVVHLVTYRRMQPALRLAAWVQLLAVTAAEPERPFSAVTIGRAEARSSRTVSTAEIATLGPDPASRKRNAEAQLGRLLELFGLGMVQPLPLYCRTSAAYAAARAAGADDADVAARQQWESSFEREQEDKDRAHQLALGGLLSYNDMVSCSGPIGDDDGAQAYDPSERTRFGYYARLLWDGLLVRERVVSR